MAVQQPSAGAVPDYTVGRARTVEVIRWLLLAVLTLDLLAGLITLPRASSLADLQRDLRAGHARSVLFVNGSSLPAVQLVRGGPWLVRVDQGFDQEMIVWRTGDASYRSAPMDLGDVFGSAAGSVDTKAELRERVTAVARQAGVPVRSGIGRDPLLVWPQAVILVFLVLLATLIFGGQPRRATKWATFWLYLLPLNAGMFLTLAREAPWSRRARELPEPLPHKQQNHDGRTTGGHAFLFMLVACAVIQALASVFARR